MKQAVARGRFRPLANLLRNDYLAIVSKKGSLLVSGLATSIVVARYLGPELRGEYAYVVSVSGVVVVGLNLGLNVRYQAERRVSGPERLPRFVTCSLLQVFVMLVLTGLGWVLDLDATWLALLALVTFSLARMQLSHYALLEETPAIAIASSSVGLLHLAVVVGLWSVSTASLELALVGLILREGLGALAALFVLARSWRLADLLELSLPSLRKTFALSALTPYAVTVLIVLNYRLDVVMLRWFDIDQAAIGIFAIAVVISEYSWLVPDTFKEVQTKRTSLGSGAQGLAVAGRASTALMALAIVCFIGTGWWAVPLVFGADYANAYLVTIPLLLSALAMSYCKIIGTMYLSHGRAKVYFWLMAAAVSANSALNAVLIPILGVWGAVAASVVSYLVAGGGFLVRLRADHGVAIRDVTLLQRADLAAASKPVSRAWQRTSFRWAAAWSRL